MKNMQFVIFPGKDMQQANSVVKAPFYQNLVFRTLLFCLEIKPRSKSSTSYNT